MMARMMVFVSVIIRAVGEEVITDGRSGGTGRGIIIVPFVSLLKIEKKKSKYEASSSDK